MVGRLEAEIAVAQALREVGRELRAEHRAATARMRDQIAEARQGMRVARNSLNAAQEREQLRARVEEKAATVLALVGLASSS